MKFICLYVCLSVCLSCLLHWQRFFHLFFLHSFLFIYLCMSCMIIKFNHRFFFSSFFLFLLSTEIIKQRMKNQFFYFYYFFCELKVLNFLYCMYWVATRVVLYTVVVSLLWIYFLLNCLIYLINLNYEKQLILYVFCLSYNFCVC